MDAPKIAPEPMMTVRVSLHRQPIGTTPFGIRAEVPFAGVATSLHWDGERTVTGIDHITRGVTGVSSLDVHTVIAGDDEIVTYRGMGRGGPTGIWEGVTFETASERLAWLNDVVAVGRGEVDGDQLVVEIFQLSA